MKSWSEIGNDKENPQEYIDIVRTADNEYTIFIEENGEKVALTTFAATQVCCAVYIDGAKKDKHVWYNKENGTALTRRSVGLWISGPNDLMESLKTGTMPVSAA